MKLITHSGGFHADDVFATAALLLYLKKAIDDVEIIRTRDLEIIKTGDYVFDVGFVYDPEARRFDHHQEAGAGVRENGIQYASFGLVWKAYGEEIADSKVVADRIDAVLVQTIDGLDTASIPIRPTRNDFWLYTVGNLIGSFEPAWGSSPDLVLKGFKEAVNFALIILQNELRKTKEEEQARSIIVDVYHAAPDKKLVVFLNARGWSRIFISSVLINFPDTIYFVRQHPDDNSWQAICVQGPGYRNRKPFPEIWAGKDGEDLQKISGVSDVRFCHRGRFMCIAESKEGAIALAQKALAL